MEPIRIRVTRILDFGTVVGIIGIDADSNAAVVVHVDHRPFQAIWNAWKAANFSQPVTYDAESLTLSLEIEPDEERTPSSSHEEARS